MLSLLFVLFCLAAPFLLMWWAVVASRRVQALPRKPLVDSAAETPYVDQVRTADGLSYSRAFSVNDELLAAALKADERSGIKDLEGRR
jgi:hypothetical protein